MNIMTNFSFIISIPKKHTTTRKSAPFFSAVFRDDLSGERHICIGYLPMPRGISRYFFSEGEARGKKISRYSPKAEGDIRLISWLFFTWGQNIGISWGQRKFVIFSYLGNLPAFWRHFWAILIRFLPLIGHSNFDRRWKKSEELFMKGGKYRVLANFTPP